MNKEVVRLERVRKVYPMGGHDVIALDGVDLTLARGEFVAIMGPSGSGKSTLMHVIGLLDRPTSGRYFFDGHDVSSLNADGLADLRSHRLGFVFQSYNLLPRTSALENVELPMVYAGVPQSERRRRALEALEIVGVPDMAGHISNQMSGGQQQRVAIARALVNDPTLILADEPTGALDTKSSDDVMRLFTRLNNERGMTILLVTHELDVGRRGKAHRDVPRRQDRLRHALRRIARTGNRMNVTTLLSIAWEEIVRNRVRSLLTMLGMIIGVAAVVITISIGVGARASIAAQITGLGSNLVIVIPGSVNLNGVRTGTGAASSLTPADGLALAKLPHVAAASPGVGMRTQVIAGSSNWSTTVLGVCPDLHVHSRVAHGVGFILYRCGRCDVGEGMRRRPDRRR